MKETGRYGLTAQVTDFLKKAEKLWDICWYRNQQGLGNKKGRPDFEILIPRDIRWATPVFIELKSTKGKLSAYQEAERNRISHAGGCYRICRSLEEVAAVFKEFGFKFELDGLQTGS